MLLPKEQLLAIIDDIRARIISGDSLEGSFEYLLPRDPDVETFEVKASYRVGNLEGQGKLRIIP